MKTINYVGAVLVLFTFSLSPASASNLDREKRMADEIVDAILDGEAVFLQANDNAFLSIYTESDEAQGVAIILHGRGFHPDWQDTVNPLRVGLAESGWNTLSVQMPVLEKQAKYYDYVPLFPEAIPRIESAIAYARERMKQKKLTGKVVLIAHSCGAHMAMEWIREKDGKVEGIISAYIGAGMGAKDYKQPMEQPFPLPKMTIPVLDIYGAKEYPAVLRMAPGRLAMIKKAGHKKSKQVVVPDANHYFTDKGDELVAPVVEWLDGL